MKNEWTEAEDNFLITHGELLGYAFIASHDLGRSGISGVRRAKWLREHHPEKFAQVDLKSRLSERQDMLNRDDKDELELKLPSLCAEIDRLRCLIDPSTNSFTRFLRSIEEEAYSE